MSTMSLAEAHENAQRMLAECDAIYGSPQYWHTHKLHENAWQQRLAERAKQQKETDRRVAKHQAMLAVRRGNNEQLVAQRGQDWAKWFGTFFNAHCREAGLDFKHIVGDDKEPTTEFGHLLKILYTNVIVEGWKQQNEFNDKEFAAIAERLKELKQRAGRRW